MPDDYGHPHLEMTREEPTTKPRPRRFTLRRDAPEDPSAHGKRLGENLARVRRAKMNYVAGYDERCLIKLSLNEFVPPEDLAKASADVEVVSQEGKNIVLAFATEGQLDAFEAKLAQLVEGNHVTYRTMIYALEGIDHWTERDRTGWALGRDGFPEAPRFSLDVELWPLSREEDAKRERDAFEEWVTAEGGKILDRVARPYLTLYRIRCDRDVADRCLRHRDVRTVDLPPSAGLSLSLITTPMQSLRPIPPPPEGAPGVAVLDTGIVAGHPVLAPAIGDTQDFVSGGAEAEQRGHGTFVAGIALYDDIGACLDRGTFAPQLRLFSGRIFEAGNRNDPKLMENRVEEAVRYFLENYGCRIFNLSYGDPGRPYRGGRVSGLAVTLDALSRELGVLFVVPTGNFDIDRHDVSDGRWMNYARYLTGRPANLIDPAPALNALTVGSVARHERHEGPQGDFGFRAMARHGEPSPFTRSGPSVRGAIKPDLVDYGGNHSVEVGSDLHMVRGRAGVGEVSTSHDFAVGDPFAEDSGTSFAAPRVAHVAARLLAAVPTASTNLCRALLVAHGRTPAASRALFEGDSTALRNLTGYGQVDQSALFRSMDNCVTLWSDGHIENLRNHFYEIPIPNEFWEGRGRRRTVTVALAYSPPPRTTRIDYCGVSISFKLVVDGSLDAVARAFSAEVDREDAPGVPERAAGRDLSAMVRSKGTAQVSTWTFTRPSVNLRKSRVFVVVTRKDPTWGARVARVREEYSLAVKMDDREMLLSSLYQRVRALLRGRARARTTM